MAQRKNSTPTATKRRPNAGAEHRKMLKDARLGLRVKQARITAGMTQVELAERTGLAQQTISHLERGLSATSGYLHLIAEALGVSVDELLKGASAVDVTGGRAIARVRDVPVYGETGHVLPFPGVWVELLDCESEFLRAWRVRDDLMRPCLPRGHWVIFDAGDRDLVSDGLYVIDTSGGVIVRRLQARVSGGLTIVADGDGSASEEIPAKEVASLRVLGRVVWSGGRV